MILDCPDDRFFIECGCHTHMMEVGWFDEDFPEAYIALWQQETPVYRWKDRIKQIWQIVRHGKPDFHEIVMSKEDVRGFIERLQKFAAVKLEGEPKFKVGDKVKIVQFTAPARGPIEETLGKVGVVRRVPFEEERFYYVTPWFYWYLEEELELA